MHLEDIVNWHIMITIHYNIMQIHDR